MSEKLNRKFYRRSFYYFLLCYDFIMIDIVIILPEILSSIEVIRIVNFNMTVW